MTGGGAKYLPTEPWRRLPGRSARPIPSRQPIQFAQQGLNEKSSTSCIDLCVQYMMRASLLMAEQLQRHRSMPACPTWRSTLHVERPAPIESAPRDSLNVSGIVAPVARRKRPSRAKPKSPDACPDRRGEQTLAKTVFAVTAPAGSAAVTATTSLPPQVAHPQHDGLLVCMVCGGRYRCIGRHLKPVHNLSPDQYRRKFGLAPETPLIVVGNRTRADQTRIDRLGDANRRRAATAVAELHAVARRLHYRDLRHLISATAAWPAADVGALVGRGRRWVWYWRNKLGVSAQLRQVRSVRSIEQCRAGLADVPVGSQPVAADGRLRCLECGVWRHLLDRHLRRQHQWTVAQYRARFGLACTVILVDQDVWRRRDAGGWQRRYRDRALRRGYPGLRDVLDRCSDAEAADVLGVTAGTVRKLRIT
ncbi:MucR family transcriptional regulator [Paractinoplanes rishiriensis]|uniref:MucR family transcriptional regulator n=1 Tax=Paractinoplanes rishiriensis TaxID=1050105 RepID=UPI0027DE057D|nr:MucR family transcriptional regulator [Actinoplanes rishiriensis]